mmetsp:Transcript_19525/g.29543  ORF Transcript_19525/g.29543 Transcript_19525/m.29543 type:complete len:283 (+) Transcript_19525:103-951(+)
MRMTAFVVPEILLMILLFSVGEAFLKTEPNQLKIVRLSSTTQWNVKENVLQQPLRASAQGEAYDSPSDDFLQKVKKIASDSGDNLSANQLVKMEELKPSDIAEMIEVTFVKACMDLAKGYVDVLKLMIVAIKAAYTSGLPFSKINGLVHAVEHSSANRALMKEEVDLRSTWICVVYLTLSQMGCEPNNGLSTLQACEGIGEDSIKKFSPIIKNIVEAATGRITVEGLSVDQFKNDIMGDEDPLAKAIMAHSIRVAILTLLVAEEEQKCSSSSTPRPRIPGTD